MKKIFCIEDNQMYIRMLSHRLSLNPEFKVCKFETGTAALEQLHEAPDVVTLDLNLPDIDGVALMEKIMEQSPSSQVIILSVENDIKLASKLFKLGAYDYVLKDENAMERIWNIVHKATSHAQLDKEVRVLREVVNTKYSFNTNIEGVSETMDKVFNLIEKSLKTNINVIVSGETGTGKELVAKTIHHNSYQKNKPFVAINVSAIPDELIESELFGYEKGSFTGANERRIGFLEHVSGGTLFLDEIAEMSQPMQAKLLRALQEMEIKRLGGNTSIPISFRLICASHKNLLDEVEKGNFRQDLYYRILGINIHLPPLRNRGKDILLLANHFIQQFAKSNDLEPKKIGLSAVKKLLSYHFPGNIRELKALMDTAMAIGDGPLIVAKDLSMPDFSSQMETYNEETTLDEFTNSFIQNTLVANDYNVLETASKLAIGKSKIYRLIKEGKIKHKER